MLSPPSHALRLALFTGAYNHIADGVSLTLNRVVGYLERQGVPVRVFAPTVDPPALQHAGTLVPLTSITAPGRPDYRVSLGVSATARAALRTFQPTLVHIATPDLAGLHARRLARRMAVPLVATYHTHFTSYLDYYRLGLLEPSVWRYLRWFYQPFRQVYVPTPSMEAVLRQQGFTGVLKPWPRGVETALFHPSKRSLAWRASLGIGEAEVVVAWVSRLVVEKGLDVYAEVVAGLKAQGLPVRALVVGEGPARAEVERRLPDALLLGYLRGEDLARAYASSDVFVFPSETETFGNVTLEAMASGLPTVCADATGSNALVHPDETGFLAPPRQTAAFLEATARLVTDAALRHRMGQAARTRAETYDWEIILARLLAYYHEAQAGG
jgi:glycosyltransferase involved in cell wall biosynthesis